MPTIFRGRDLDAMSVKQREHWVLYHGGSEYLLYSEAYRRFLDQNGAARKNSHEPGLSLVSATLRMSL